MQVLIVADTYPPLRTSGAVQLRDLAAEFARQGHEPTVIVPTDLAVAPSGLERANGVAVLRCRTRSTKDIGYFRRTINEMRLPYTLLRGLRESGLRHTRWHGVIWYSPTIFLAPIVRAIRRESGCRSYLILRDIFPEWAVDMGLMRRGVAYRFFKKIERNQYSVADAIGVQSESNLPYLSEWAKIPGRRLEVLQNWLAEAAERGCSIRLNSTTLAGRMIFAYAGNMGVAQGMDVLLELVTRMHARKDIGFLFVGRGSDAVRLAKAAASKRLENVIFHDEIDPSEIPGLLSQCHLGLLALDPRHKTHNVPGKFLAYMQAGLPVLARINPGNDLEQLINDERVGRVSTGGDASELEKLAYELISDSEALKAMGARARALSRRRFSAEIAVKQIVHSLSGPSGSDGASTRRHDTAPAQVVGSL